MIDETVIEHRLTEVEALADRNANRLTKIEKRQDSLEDLTSTVKVLALREENVEKDVKEIKADVKELTSKPAKRWDELVTKIIMTVVAAVVGFLLAKFGL